MPDLFKVVSGKVHVKWHCIYLIICKGNSRVYVGSTCDYQQRKDDHLKCLRRGKHANAKLQRSFNKYGEESLQFFSFVGTDYDELIPEEQIWIEYFNASEEGLNIAKFASSGFRGRRWSEEMKMKMSLSKKGKNCGKDNYFYGKKHPPEVIQKMSQAKIGKYEGDKNPFYRKSHSEDQKDKWKISRKGRCTGDKSPTYGLRRPQYVKDALFKAHSKSYLVTTPLGVHA